MKVFSQFEQTIKKRLLQIAIRSQERSSVKNGVQIRAEARLTLPGSAPGHEVQTAGVGTLEIFFFFSEISQVPTVIRFHSCFCT